ncbi:hypothetical protein ARMA_0085 [Ardenticatena maritima]|uniref:Uncharacterized protein n=1 Tax=Ardenticatena maritima TaxID=872965 RepID=A0A0M8K4T7_9CHLR|nr:hypothetical protein ARMA_0085 [Ardenticatena maritima]
MRWYNFQCEQQRQVQSLAFFFSAHFLINATIMFIVFSIRFMVQSFEGT